jgi:hypothetical protein
MKKQLVWLITAFNLFCMTKAFAIDPIGWQLNGSVPETVNVNAGSYSISYTLTNNLPITLVKPLVILNQADPGDEYSLNDGCSGENLDSLATCNVTITLTPTSPGEKSIAIAISGYANDVVWLPTISTTAVNNSGVTITGSVTQALPTNTMQGQSNPFAFQFSNTGTSSATGVSIQVNTANYSTTCTNTLTAGSNCTVTGSYTAPGNITGNQTVTATFSFNQGPSVNESTSTNVVAQTGLSCEITTPLPSTMQNNAVANFAYQCINNSASPISITTVSDTLVALGGSFNVTDTGCDSSVDVPAGGNCTRGGQYTAPNSPTTGTARYTSTITANSTHEVTTATVVSNNTPTNSRTLSFVNDCNFPVWFSLVGGNRPDVNGNIIPCQTSDDCPDGSQCNPASNGGTGQCFWRNYGPADNDFMLAANGGINTVVMPNTTTAADDNVFWSGVGGARTGCDGSNTCTTAQCNGDGGSKACQAGVGFTQPATQAEFTFVNNKVDTYDVEVINGFHIPIEMKPTGGQGVTVSNYDCGAPGAPTQGNGFGACDWNNAAPPSNDYYWVTDGGATCTSSSSCSANQLCGFTLAVEKKCGNFLGFMSANEACALNESNAEATFHCNQFLPAPTFPANTYQLTDLYGCKVPDKNLPTLNSCYLDGATDACCGCADWQDLSGITLPGSTLTCNAHNTTWRTQVQPGLEWIKKTCPNYYTYPFDDKSSTFTCSNIGGGNTTNTTNYTITFCPGGNTGLPSGKTDGRSATT